MSISKELGIESVELAPQVIGNRRVQVHARDDEGRGICVVALATDDGYVCEKVTVDGSDEPVTSDTLRAIPASSIAKAAAYSASWVEPGDVLGLNVPWLLWPSYVMDEWPNGDREVVFRFTAATYTLAAFHGLGPTKAVRDASGVSQATAGRLIRTARDAGFLTAEAPARSGGRGSALLIDFLERIRVHWQEVGGPEFATRISTPGHKTEGSGNGA